MRRLLLFKRSTPEEPSPAPRIIDPRKPPDDLSPEVALFLRGPIDGRDDWLEAFLAEPELDNLRTFHTAEDLTAQQTARVRAILASGQPRQARFNLLLNPGLLPEDARLGALMAGLSDPDPYMRIAAATGLQHDGDTPVAPEDWPPVRDALIARLDDGEPAIRNRASVTLAIRATRGDGPALEAAVTHGTEAPNLLIACIRADADDAALALLPRLLARDRLHAETRTYLERWERTGRRPDGDPTSFMMLPALGYIPNLDEM